jgi:hypothetical protein
MDVEKRASLFGKLGEILFSYLNDERDDLNFKLILDEAVLRSKNNNPWFDEDSQRKALRAIALMLNKEAIYKWLASYPEIMREKGNAQTVALIMAGNIPLVGFHDLMCVLISGNKALVKVSSNDPYLMPAILKILSRIEPEIESFVVFTSSIIKGFDAVIATGSNNSARYFEYYFSKYPHIIRRNRNGIALLHGNETTAELISLGDDVFSYYGMGCRNITKLYVPENYDFIPLIEAWQKWDFLKNHTRFFNNYEYHKAVFLVNSVPHLDSGFFLISSCKAIASPVAVLFYENYSDKLGLLNELGELKEKIQCITGDINTFTDVIALGTAQNPELGDYADGVDTMRFLIDLSN